MPLTHWTRRQMLWLLAGAIGGASLHACSSSSSTSASKPLGIGISAWPGFAGNYVATARGFFTAAGLSNQETFFTVASDVNTALLAGRLDLAWTGGPDTVVLAAKDPSLRLIAVSDYSDGADGVLVRGISQAADLKGKTIAWEGMPLQVLLLRKCLESGGLTEKDVKLTVLPAAEAASAFAAKKIDVAVTYEPYLTKSVTEGGGQVLFSSKGSNIIPSVLVGREAFIKERQADLVSYLKALDQGIQLVRDQPQETAAEVAAKLGVAPAEVAALLKTVRSFNMAEQKSIVFNPSNPLNVMDSLDFAVKTSQAIGLIPNAIDSKTLYDDSIVKAL